MLRSLQEIKTYALGATDGECGPVNDLLFDEQDWGIRYFVTLTGPRLMGRTAMISPHSVAATDWEHRRVPLTVTRQQIKKGPQIANGNTPTRRQEMCNAEHFGYPYYWAGDASLGDGLRAHLGRPTDYLTARAQAAALAAHDPHLHSCKDVVGLHLHSKDGDLGQIGGVLVDDGLWVIRYLVVDTGHWWQGNQILIPPEWVLGVHWGQARAIVDVRRETLTA